MIMSLILIYINYIVKM